MFKCHGRFARRVFIVCLILALPLAYNYFFLTKSGEFLTPEQIYVKQNTGDFVIYSSGVLEGVTEPKLYAYAQKKPHIVSFGSSRVLQFRQNSFNSSFYNLGYTFATIAEALDITPQVLSIHLPEVVILGVDYWWFNTAYASDDYADMTSVPKNNLSSTHLLKPFHWIKTKNLTFKEYIVSVFKSNNAHIGVKAKYNLVGVGADGSYYYTDIITGKARQFNDQNFNDKKQRVRDSERKFEHGSRISENHFNKFLEVIAMLQSKGIKVILFLPPYAPDLNTYMKDFNYAYFDDLKEHLQAANLKFYDYTNPHDRIKDTSNCEFIDGMHGGEVLYARILRDLASHEPELAVHVDLNYISEITTKYSGFGMIPNSKLTQSAEVDFLCYSCPKDAS